MKNQIDYELLKKLSKDLRAKEFTELNILDQIYYLMNQNALVLENHTKQIDGLLGIIEKLSDKLEKIEKDKCK